MSEHKAPNRDDEEQSSTPDQQAAAGSTQQAGEPTEKENDLAAQVQQYKDLLLRKAAEFENYKRRAENEAFTVLKYANEGLISELLPVMDDLERSLKAGKERQDFEPFYRGIELIHQKLTKIMSARGLKAIEAVGQPFNVELHDALLQVHKDDVPPYTILEEVEKGYTLHDKVIRHAKVIVSAPPLQKEPVGAPEVSSDREDTQHSSES